jgi:hypothetical protein
MALLPEHDGYGLVWTAKPARAQELLAFPDREFLAQLARHFGARSGRFTRVADRRTFPLAMEYVREPARARCVALGNAAQTLHPVADRIQSRFARRMGARLDRPRLAARATGDDTMLSRYSRGRRTDRMAVSRSLTDSFVCSATIFRCCAGLAVGAHFARRRSRREKAFTRAMLFGVR